MARKSPLTKIEKEAIVDVIKEGHPIETLVVMAGRSKTTIYDIAKAAGLKVGERMDKPKPPGRVKSKGSKGTAIIIRNKEMTVICISGAGVDRRFLEEVRKAMEEGLGALASISK